MLPAEDDTTRLSGRGDVVELDVGRHLVGHITLHLTPYTLHLTPYTLHLGLVHFGQEGVPDSPTRVRVVFLERRRGSDIDPKPYGGRLILAWVQDEVVTADQRPASISLPRRQG